MGWDDSWRRDGGKVYQPTPQTEEPFDGEKDIPQARPKRGGIVYAGAGILAVLALIVLISVLATRTNIADHNCGSSVAEARAKKCIYEPMQRAWIPAACYYPEPADEYSPFTDRDWFLDEKLTTQADPDALQAGDIPVAFVGNFHQEHCTYNWRKLVIALNTGRRVVDSRVGNFHHATHCAIGLAEQTKNISDCGKLTYTKSNINFLSCMKLK